MAVNHQINFDGVDNLPMVSIDSVERCATEWLSLRIRERMPQAILSAVAGTCAVDDCECYQTYQRGWGYPAPPALRRSENPKTISIQLTGGHSKTLSAHIVPKAASIGLATAGQTAVPGGLSG